MPIAAHTPNLQGQDDSVSHSAQQSAFSDRSVLVLGIESSCDETAASVLRRAPDGGLTILSSVIASQDEAHAKFGGVVPEIAARAHMDKIDLIIEQAIDQAAVSYSDLDAVAATAGPGLIGGVIAGLMAAKGLSLSLDVPLIAVNHLEGHALSPRLAKACDFPYLLLLVSGGHTQLLCVDGLGSYTRLGSTVDDAAGEAFDKTAKVMGLGFPGGPKLENAAKRGNPKAAALPRPFGKTAHSDFSFSGLKTATARAWEMSEKTPAAQADIAASFQKAVCDVISSRTKNAMRAYLERHPQVKTRRFVVAGGVAANQTIRKSLLTLCAETGFTLFAPPLKFCTDNAAMIALAGAERLVQGDQSPLDIKARPRWPLDAAAAKDNPASGSGRKGAKS